MRSFKKLSPSLINLYGNPFFFGLSHNNKIQSTITFPLTNGLRYSFAVKTVDLPFLADSINEGTVAEFKKKQGDWVDLDETVANVETDKVTVQIKSPVAGIVKKFHVSEGDNLDVGKAFFDIDTDGKKSGDQGSRKETQESKDTQNDKQEPQESKPSSKSQKPKDKDKQKDGKKSQEPQSSNKNKESTPPQTDSKKQNATPGYGHSSKPLQTPKQSPKSNSNQQKQSSKQPDSKKESQKAQQKQPKSQSSSLQAFQRKQKREKMSRLRQTVASRLKDSQNKYALLTTFQEVDMGQAQQLRKSLGEDFLKKYGIKLGFMSLFMRAVTLGLQEYPIVNSAIDGNEIVRRNYVDISVAVATPTGLMVPVLRNCHNLKFHELELGMGELAKKGKEGKITLQEMQGGTFTISNGGTFGSLMGTPIINPPQSAILGMHSIINRPVVKGDQIMARPMMYLALTYDHRLLDGKDAVLFLKRIQTHIEDPKRMLLQI